MTTSPSLLPQSYFGRRDLWTVLLAGAAVLLWFLSAWRVIQASDNGDAAVVTNFYFGIALFISFWWPQWVRNPAKRARMAVKPDERELLIQYESLWVGFWIMFAFALLLPFPSVLRVGFGVEIGAPDAPWHTLWIQLGMALAFGVASVYRLRRYRSL